MRDSVQRFLFERAPIRGEIAHLESAWQRVLERHDYPPPLRALLGELMAAAALLAATIKFEGSLIVQMQGDGPVSLLVAECDDAGALRATAKWRGELEAGPLAEMLGEGRCAITLAAGPGGQSYQGIVGLEGGSVAAVLEHYLRRSEQIETRLWLAVEAERAAGLLLQKLPHPGEDEDWRRAQHLAGTLTAEELLGLPARALIRRLYAYEDVRLFDPRPLAFHCSCTRERVVAMLRMLGYDEVSSILAERGAVDVGCEFCGQSYRFDRWDAERVFTAAAAAEQR
ncbi:MAG TPA: Hsp33 family molecular chaperone HslO [Burkholderiales bacterium]|nr:Hsp33 family molecular chaperone HslO [Burkholderiales bacterium]